MNIQLNSQSPMLTVMADTDWLRGPNFEDVAFLNEPAKWLIGLILAVVIIAGSVMLALTLLKLLGADRNKAKYVGEGALITFVAIFLAWTFQDFIGTFLGSLA